MCLNATKCIHVRLNSSLKHLLGGMCYCYPHFCIGGNQGSGRLMSINQHLAEIRLQIRFSLSKRMDK